MSLEKKPTTPTMKITQLKIGLQETIPANGDRTYANLKPLVEVDFECSAGFTEADLEKAKGYVVKLMQGLKATSVPCMGPVQLTTHTIAQVGPAPASAVAAVAPEAVRPPDPTPATNHAASIQAAAGEMPDFTEDPDENPLAFMSDIDISALAG